MSEWWDKTNTYRPQPPSGSCTDRRYRTISFFQASGRQVLVTWHVISRPGGKERERVMMVNRTKPLSIFWEGFFYKVVVRRIISSYLGAGRAARRSLLPSDRPRSGGDCRSSCPWVQRPQLWGQQQRATQTDSEERRRKLATDNRNGQLQSQNTKSIIWFLYQINVCNLILIIVIIVHVYVSKRECVFVDNRKVKTHCVQAQGVGLQHGLLSLHSFLIFDVGPGLSALNIGQPPAAQVCDRFRPVRSPAPPQVPGRTHRYSTSVLCNYQYQWLLSFRVTLKCIHTLNLWN